jgi:hypothetical protein
MRDPPEGVAAAAAFPAGGLTSKVAGTSSAEVALLSRAMSSFVIMFRFNAVAI